MAVPKLDLQGAGLVDESLRLTRHERTQDWLQQNCTAQSDSLDDTETIFSVPCEITAPLYSSQSKRCAAKCVRSAVQGWRRDSAWQETDGQVLSLFARL